MEVMPRLNLLPFLAILGVRGHHLSCVTISWATGINRVAVWSFGNMYSEAECWERFRLPKSQLPHVLRELGLADSGTPDGMWRCRLASGHKAYSFQPMELLVVFLCRMSSCNTWSLLVRFLGGRSPTAYKAAFAFALEHLHAKFASRMGDFSRCAPEAEAWASAIYAAGRSTVL